jgi:hypothetical protein
MHRILRAASPDTFASLVLLNSKWRSVAQQAHLYAHHLRQCPSYAASHKGQQLAATDENLPKLRKLFSREVKRNLFEAYLRPSQTVVKLISNSISSSSCPGGEGLQFSPSPLGHHMLAYSSSRIYVLDLTKPEITVARELKILRRPAATCIKDDGSLLAVLLSEMEVDLYDLTATPPKRIKSIILDHSPRAIALSPCGSVLAAAYEGGIEVSSLNSEALATDRRAVKCDAVDTLSFSFDGTQILGTTVQSSAPNTAILTAPYYDPGSQMSEDTNNMSALWTTSILFPNTSRDCSHAVLLQDGRHEDASWAFTYDRAFETFRAVRIDDLRNGTTYFTGPMPTPNSQAKLLPCALPAASYHGELVSAGFRGKEIWLYGVPEDLDAVADAASASNATADGNTVSGGLHRRGSGPSIRSVSRNPTESADTARVAPWQALCDNARNTFVGGSHIADLDGVSTFKWVSGFGDSSLKERLVVAARGIMPTKPSGDDDGVDFVDGGRVILVDFDYGTTDGSVTEVTVEVGTKEPEVLEEEQRDMDTEVAIVRRRTVAQNRGSRTALMRAATTAAAPGAGGLPGSRTGQAMPHVPPPMPSGADTLDDDDADNPLIPRRIGALPGRPEEPTVVEEADEETAEIIEQEALDAPYAHAAPRSGTTLRRAATAAAAGHITYRRADGRAEHPHESDADNWVPPPPPYQRDDPKDLPVFLRHGTTPVIVTAPPKGGVGSSQDVAGQSTVFPQSQPARSQTVLAIRRDNLPQRSATQLSNHRLSASAASPSRPPPLQTTAPRPLSHHSNYVGGDNVYDVSPPESPTRANSNEQREARMHNGTSPESASTVTPPHAVPEAALAVPASPHRAQQARSPPNLELRIPSQGSNPSQAWPLQDQGGSIATPAIKRISNSQTWPAPPKPPTSAAMPAGYPYSAPPTSMTSNEAMAQAYPPAPRPDQLASLDNHHRSAPPKRLSGGFQRVPVGSRNSSAAGQWAYRTASGGPLQQYRQSSSPQTILSPQPRRPVSGSGSPSSAPPPDTPLIISTPRGVTGAFDPPGQPETEQQGEPVIVAPVPRHPRPQTQAAVLRPAMDRMETIYSVSSQQGEQPMQAAPGGLGPIPGSANQLLAQPLPGPGSNASSQTVRHPSLNAHRSQSRAERSAAKNMADAKKRGWTGRRKSKKIRKGKDGNGRDVTDHNGDNVSSAAWTDVSYSSAGFAAGAGPSGSGQMGYGNGDGRMLGHSATVQARQGQVQKERKCVVM